MKTLNEIASVFASVARNTDTDAYTYTHPGTRSGFVGHPGQPLHGLGRREGELRCE